jgi:hypothetical protein
MNETNNNSSGSNTPGTKEMSDESVVDILDMWRNVLEKAKCIARYTIIDKLIDYDLLPDTEYNCNECISPFCFKKMEWDDDQEMNISKNGMSSPKILEQNKDNLYTLYG